MCFPRPDGKNTPKYAPSKAEKQVTIVLFRERNDQKMDVDLIFRIAAIGIIVAVLNQVLIRSGREEQAMMTTLAGLIVVLTILVTQISTLFGTIQQMFGLY